MPRKQIPLRLSEEAEQAMYFIREASRPASSVDLPSLNTVVASCLLFVADAIKHDGREWTKEDIGKFLEAL